MRIETIWDGQETVSQGKIGSLGRGERKPGYLEVSKSWEPLLCSLKRISPGCTVSGTVSSAASGSLTSR
jgi:hypothetical protein